MDECRLTEMRHGPHPEQVMRVEEGDFLYIPAGVFTSRTTRPPRARARALLARTDPNEQESVSVVVLDCPPA
jgi:uncharacterized RmlC-like cupin family protein